MTFPPTPAGGRAAECKPSPRKAAAAHPAELPPQPPQPPKNRQFFKLAICLKPQVCKAPEIAKEATRSRRRDPAEPPPAGAATAAEIIATAAEAAAAESPSNEGKAANATPDIVLYQYKPRSQPSALYINIKAGEDTSSGGNICQQPRAAKQERSTAAREAEAEHRQRSGGSWTAGAHTNLKAAGKHSQRSAGRQPKNQPRTAADLPRERAQQPRGITRGGDEISAHPKRRRPPQDQERDRPRRNLPRQSGQQPEAPAEIRASRGRQQRGDTCQQAATHTKLKAPKRRRGDHGGGISCQAQKRRQPERRPLPRDRGSPEEKPAPNLPRAAKHTPP